MDDRRSCTFTTRPIQSGPSDGGSKKTREPLIGSNPEKKFTQGNLSRNKRSEVKGCNALRSRVRTDSPVPWSVRNKNAALSSGEPSVKNDEILSAASGSSRTNAFSVSNAITDPNEWPTITMWL